MPIVNTRAIYFPYCLQELKDKSWVVLNRNYKPVGSGTTEFVEYEDVIQDRMRIARITPAQAKKISYKGEIDGTVTGDRTIYLYNDGCIPTSSEKDMAAYLKRLAVLMKLKLVANPE